MIQGNVTASSNQPTEGYYLGGWKLGDIALYTDFGLRSLYVVEIVEWPEKLGERFGTLVEGPLYLPPVIHDRSQGSVRAKVIDTTLVNWDFPSMYGIVEKWNRVGTTHYYHYTNLYRNVLDLIRYEARTTYPEVQQRIVSDLMSHPGWELLKGYGLVGGEVKSSSASSDRREVKKMTEFTPEVQTVIDKWQTQIAEGKPLIEAEARREIIRASGYRGGVGETDRAMRAIRGIRPGNPSGTEVYVQELPKCDFCDKPAGYDGATRMGPWAYMCQEHFRQYGLGLGTGRGQKLIPRKVLGEAERIRGEPEKELSVRMTEEDLEVATVEDVWHPVCPYCGAETPAEPDAHAVYCLACSRRFKIINPFF